jgi:hypothetical protein
MKLRKCAKIAPKRSLKKISHTAISQIPKEIEGRNVVIKLYFYHWVICHYRKYTIIILIDPTTNILLTMGTLIIPRGAGKK